MATPVDQGTPRGSRVEVENLEETSSPAPARPRAATQLRLFPAPRPLEARLGVEFFRRVPRQPGVYLMRDGTGRLIYVGKAKDLRQRLNSYRNSAGASRKTVRLIHSVAQIDYELLASDEAAQLRENLLLRTHRPRLNRANTWPAANGFVTLERGSGRLRLTWTRTPEELVGPGARALAQVAEPERWFSVDSAAEPLPQRAGAAARRVFGAFKPGARSACAALARLLWAGVHRGTMPEALPRALVLARPPPVFTLEGAAALEWYEPIEAYLDGVSSGLVERLDLAVPVPESAFHVQFRQADFEEVRRWFCLGPRRNRELCARLGRCDRLLRPEDLDDLLVYAEPAATV